MALKVLKPELAAVMGGDRFIAEIRTTANLQQPGMHAATYDVHPEGFVLALDESRTAGRIVVWKDWIGELEGVLER